MTTAELMAAPSIPLGPATPPPRLAELASTGGVAVRLRVAAHPNTDVNTLLLLAGDVEQAVREQAARRLPT